MAPEDLHLVIRQIGERLAAIETAIISLNTQSCERHQRWLANHEERVRASEEKLAVICEAKHEERISANEKKIAVIWVLGFLAICALGYWLQCKFGKVV